MKTIGFSQEIKEAAQEAMVLQIEAQVANAPTCDALWAEIEAAANEIREKYVMEMIARRPAIAATRKVYKALGKEPNRYRPSAEALCRRMINGKGLYRLTTLVDLINLVSMLTGYSIGGFDSDKIAGDNLTLGVGKNGEPFEAISRGQLNIEFLPVYRDGIGGIGTPTSDCERTKLTADTRRLLMLVNIYGVEMSIDDTLSLIVRLLKDYASATEIQSKLLNVSQSCCDD